MIVPLGVSLWACHPEQSEGSAFVLCVTADSLARGYDGGMHEGSYCTYIMASRSRTLYFGEGTEGLETRKETCADRIDQPRVDGSESRLVRL